MQTTMRVVSLLPSATEMLALVFDESKLKFVGRSHECDFPKLFVANIPTLTTQKTHFSKESSNPAKDIDEQVKKSLSEGNSLYDLNIEKLVELQPDVVLTQSLCEVCSIDLITVERVCKKMKIPAVVVDLNPKSLQEVLDDILRVGKVVGCEDKAMKVLKELQSRVTDATLSSRSFPRTKAQPKIGFMEWTDPIFVGGHWTPEIISMAGGIHVLNEAHMKSIQVSDESFSKADPDIIIVCPCGMNLSQTRNLMEIVLNDPARGPWFRSLRAFENKHVVLVDGNEMFNRPGPRLVECLEWCTKLFQTYDTKGDLSSSTSVPFPWEML